MDEIIFKDVTRDYNIHRVKGYRGQSDVTYRFWDGSRPKTNNEDRIKRKVKDKRYFTTRSEKVIKRLKVKDPNTPLTSILYFSSSDDDNGMTLEEELLQSHARKLRSVRGSVKPLEWLSLISEIETDFETVFSDRTMKRHAFEKQISILSEALAQCPTSEQLWERLADVTTKFLERHKTDDVWDAAIRQVPSSATLWSGLISWKSRNFATFNVTSVRKLYSVAIRKLVAAKHLLIDKESVKEIPILEQNVAQIIAAAAFFEKRAGYTERGVAILQSVLDISTATDNVELTRWSDRFNWFRQFWELELPRIGTSREGNFNDWYLSDKSVPFVKNSKPNPPSSIGQINNSNQNESDNFCRNTIQQWLSQQKLMSSTDWEPLLPSEKEIAHLNPDRVVLFEDISDCLSPIYFDTNVRLLYYYLIEFMGFHVMYEVMPFNDQILKQQLTLISSEVLLEVFSCDWRDRFTWRPGVDKSQMSESKIIFIRRILDGLSQTPDGQYFQGIRMSFEYHLDSKAGLRFSKHFLCNNIQDTIDQIPLWLQYSDLLVRNKDFKLSGKVFSVILPVVAQSLKSGNKLEEMWFVTNMHYVISLLWHSAHELGDICTARDRNKQTLKLTQHHVSRILHACISLSETQYSPLTDISTLHQRSSFAKENLRKKITSADGSVKVSAAFCLAVMETLLCSVKEGINVFTEAFQGNKLPTELQILKCKIVAIPRMIGQAFEPNIVLSTLRDAAKENSDHPGLLSVYINFELEYGTTRNARMLLTDTLRRHSYSNAVISLFCSHVEHLLGNEIRSKDILDRSLLTVGCSPVESVWIKRIQLAYNDLMELEYHRPDIDNQKKSLSINEKISIRRREQRKLSKHENMLEPVKAIFYGAIAAVPSSITIWTEGLRLLERAFSDQELQDIIDLIHEKDLHLRIFIEELK